MYAKAGRCSVFGAEGTIACRTRHDPQRTVKGVRFWATNDTCQSHCTLRWHNTNARTLPRTSVPQLGLIGYLQELSKNKPERR
jgi:hypothetical protein